jgi:DNA-binding response OmpR family regulator
MDTNRVSLKVLIIEDNPGDLVLLDCYLHEQFKNPDVAVARNFNDAEKAFLKSLYNFDVVLLDLSLPDKCGGELIEEVLTLSSNVPVIVLTGYTDINFGARTLGMGISDYILKDELTAALLYKSIIYTLERKKSTDALREISWIQSHMVRAPVARILGLIPLLGEIDESTTEIIHYLSASANELDRAIKTITKKITLRDLDQNQDTTKVISTN